MKLSIVCLFFCLVCVTWCDYDVISMTRPCTLCILDIQYTCLPKIIWNCLHSRNLCILSQSLLYFTETNKQTRKITSKFNFSCENLDIDQVSNIIIKETKVRNKWNTTFLIQKVWSEVFLIQKSWQMLENFTFSGHLMLPQQQQQKSAICHPSPSHGRQG